MAFEPIYNRTTDVRFYHNGQWFKQYRHGFAAFFDPDDPILICQAIECENMHQNGAFRFGHLSDKPFLGWSQFKVYIPPGCTEIDLLLFPPQNAEVGVAARFGQPPITRQGDRLEDHNWIKSPKAPWDFAHSDVLIRNTGGHIQIMGRPFPVVQRGDWLYVRVLNWGSYIYKYSLAMKVDMAPYRHWFRNTDFWSDLQGDIGSWRPVDDLVIPEDPPEPDPTNIEYSMPEFSNWIERTKAQRLALFRTINPIVEARNEVGSIHDLKYVYGLVLEEGTLTPVLNELAAQLQVSVDMMRYDLWVYFGMREGG